MPAIAAIAVLDGKPTPVSHSFSPVTTDGQKAKWANRAATIPQGYETLEVEIRPPASTTGAYRMIGKMTFPTVGTVNGQDAVVRADSADFTFNFSQLSTVQDREDRVVIVSNILINAIVKAMAENVEPAY